MYPGGERIVSTRPFDMTPPAVRAPPFHRKVPSPPYVSANPSAYQEGITAGVTPYWKRCDSSWRAIPRTISGGMPSAQTSAVNVGPSAKPEATLNSGRFAPSHHLEYVARSL